MQHDNRPEEPIDPNQPGDELPWVGFARGDDPDGGGDGDERAGETDEEEPPRRTWWFVVAAAVLVVAGLTIGIIVFNNSAPDPNRGTRTAQEAAAHYVRALNDGDGDAAAGISCESFLKTARAEARSGKEGIRFRVVSVKATADDTAVSVIEATLAVADAKQTDRERIAIFRTKGLWLMCGQD